MTTPLSKSAAAIGVIGLVAAMAVTGCSSSSSGSGASASPSATSSGAPNALPPIPITKAEDINVKVGNYLNVTTPNVTRVSTDNAAVLEVSQPHSDGSATFNGGAKVIAPGKATLVTYGGVTNSEMYTVNVTASN